MSDFDVFGAFVRKWRFCPTFRVKRTHTRVIFPIGFNTKPTGVAAIPVSSVPTPVRFALMPSVIDSSLSDTGISPSAPDLATVGTYLTSIAFDPMPIGVIIKPVVSVLSPTGVNVKLVVFDTSPTRLAPFPVGNRLAPSGFNIEAVIFDPMPDGVNTKPIVFTLGATGFMLKTFFFNTKVISFKPTTFVFVATTNSFT